MGGLTCRCRIQCRVYSLLLLLWGVVGGLLGRLDCGALVVVLSAIVFAASLLVVYVFCVVAGFELRVYLRLYLYAVSCLCRGRRW